MNNLNCPILVCTKIEDESFGIRVIKRGAAGFISKSAGSQEILNAIACVTSGRKYISASLSQKLINQIQPGYSGQLHDTLSDREFQVLQKLAQGVSTKEMAAQMSLSAKTVSTYRVRVMKKLGVKNLVELVEYCVENGMTKKQARV
jgi:DNA-binding NarL/FixJ family response regulator